MKTWADYITEHAFEKHKEKLGVQDKAGLHALVDRILNDSSTEMMKANNHRFLFRNRNEKVMGWLNCNQPEASTIYKGSSNQLNTVTNTELMEAADYPLGKKAEFPIRVGGLAASSQFIENELLVTGKSSLIAPGVGAVNLTSNSNAISNAKSFNEHVASLRQNSASKTQAPKQSLAGMKSKPLPAARKQSSLSSQAMLGSKSSQAIKQTSMRGKLSPATSANQASKKPAQVLGQQKGRNLPTPKISAAGVKAVQTVKQPNRRPVVNPAPAGNRFSKSAQAAKHAGQARPAQGAKPPPANVGVKSAAQSNTTSANKFSKAAKAGQQQSKPSGNQVTPAQNKVVPPIQNKEASISGNPAKASPAAPKVGPVPSGSAAKNPTPPAGPKPPPVATSPRPAPPAAAAVKPPVSKPAAKPVPTGAKQPPASKPPNRPARASVATPAPRRVSRPPQPPPPRPSPPPPRPAPPPPARRR